MSLVLGAVVAIGPVAASRPTVGTRHLYPTPAFFRRLAGPAVRPLDGDALRPRVRDVLRLLRVFESGLSAFRRPGHADLAGHAGHRARGEHGGDRAGPVRRAAHGRVPAAQRG